MGPRRRDETTGGTGGGGGSGGANSGRIESHGEDDHNNRNSAHHQDVDDEPEHIVVENDGTAQADRDVWAAAEGYTPLADIAGNDDEGLYSVMVSLGPSNNDNDEDGNAMGEENVNNDDEGSIDDDGPGRGSNWHRHGGAFFVNPSAFNISEPDNYGIDDDGGKEEKDDEIDPRPSLTGYDTIPTVDFEDVAARALRALDDEYISSAAIGTSNTSDPSTSAADATNSHSSSSESQQQMTDPEERRDNEIIAAAFDRRKEELDRIKEQGGFIVDWSADTDLKQSIQLRKQEQQDSTAELPPVDTDAVRRAVEALSSKSDAPFQQKFAAWQEKQEKNMKKDSNPSDHAIIPTVSCKAFYKSTPKAKEATGNLTRSATIAEALVRLQLTSQPKSSSSSSSSSPSTLSTLVVDVIGVDHVECASSETILRAFQPLVRWLGTPSSEDKDVRFYDQIHFRLSGRDLMTNITTVDLLTNIGPSVSSKIKKATATCHSGTYHEILEDTNGDDEDFNNSINPEIIIAFNAGIWGYSEWEETIRYLVDRQVVSNFIITAYTLDECQEDCEVIERVVSTADGTTSTGCRSKILWKPERNPFGSKVVRETKSSASEYRENAAWQAWRLGGSFEKDK